MGPLERASRFTGSVLLVVVLLWYFVRTLSFLGVAFQTVIVLVGVVVVGILFERYYSWELIKNF